MSQVYMVFDYETFSECDLKSVGGWEYSCHESTEILCIAFRIGTREELTTAKTHEVLLGEGGPSFARFVKALNDPTIKLVAHNAFFEMCITRNVFAKRRMYSMTYLQNIPIERWLCTAAMAASAGLPRSLDGATNGYGLRHKKDMVGHKLMLKLCKPRLPTKNNANTRHSDIDEYSRLVTYCVHDIDAEVELFLKLPAMPETEMRFWYHDMQMNQRGFAVDRDLVTSAIEIANDHKQTLEQELSIITQGRLRSTRQVVRTQQILKEQGLRLHNLQAGTVAEALAAKELTPLAKRILEIRQETSRSSVAKYSAFDVRSRSDGRARDNIHFYGAHTGRGSGNGLQPQNLFKRVIPQTDVDRYIGQICDGWLESDKHSVSDILASCLRSCIVAPEGKYLLVGDFSTIEVRVLFWLADHSEGLDAIRNGKDLYIDMASRIYRKPEAKIKRLFKAGNDMAQNMRQLGKQTVLGAGFGIGVGGEKFQKAAKGYGLDISLELAQRAVKTYRDVHKPIPSFWSDIEEAALKAMASPGKTFKCGKLKWRKEKGWLLCRLPIGRMLYYYKPKVLPMPSMYGDKPTLTYMAVNSVTKKFERTKTWGGKLTENVVQAVARDLLYSAAIRVERALGVDNVLTVHDEIVSETSDKRDLPKFLGLLAESPPWCSDLPIVAEGWIGTRYRK